MQIQGGLERQWTYQLSHIQQLTLCFSYLLEQDLSLSATTATEGVHHFFQGTMNGSGIAPKPIFMETISDLDHDI
jgi:hypothetical protein